MSDVKESLLAEIEADRRKSIAHWRGSDRTPQYLVDHLLNVSRYSCCFSKKIRMEVAGELIGLLHDLGKYSEDFRCYLHSALDLINPDEDDYVDAGALRGKIDHSSAGAQFIWQILSTRGERESVIGQLLALCIASHHSGLIDCLDPEGSDVFGKRMKKPEEKTHLEEVRSCADPEILARARALLESPELIAETKNLLSALRLQEKNSRPLLQQVGLTVRFLFSCLIDADRIDTANFEQKKVAANRPQGDYVPWSVLIERLEKALAEFVPRHPIDHLRQKISVECKNAAARSAGIYTLTVPTGGGKTLASLRFALHHAERRKLDRIIYVIPFTSIIDQNAKVVRDILEPDGFPQDRGKVVLEHHSSVTPEKQTWREKMLCENWDAPVVYTTMVQLLETLFGSGTRGARRMHQLANAVLIFDEIQTLPIRCVHLFNNAINFLNEQCNSTVVLCTATQPLLHKVAVNQGAIHLAEGHEIVSDVRQLFADLKRVEIIDQRRPNGWSYPEIADLARAEVARVVSCLVIVNTKDAARQIFLASQALVDAESLFHLSTDMCPMHRKSELAKIKSRLESGLPTLCVSTQLIEAGVDVDFGAVIRSMAGLDSIAQAAGRCNRNGKSAQGQVHLVNPSDEHVTLEYLKDIAIGRDKVASVLDFFRETPERYEHDLLGPQALADYYTHYFFERQKDMVYPVSPKEAKAIGRNDSLLSLLSENGLSLAEAGREGEQISTRLLNQSFMSAADAFKAIDSPAQGVVVPWGKAGTDLIGRLHGAYDISLEGELLREAQQFTVNVFPHVFDKLSKAGALHAIKEGVRIFSLDPWYYSKQFGLATEPVSLMETLNV
ncbi:CRISPR-associated helicase Cas3' [Rhodocyclus tenuis]|uniref:CRISPR-associated helicase Cas3' n=1 Tax=Rhodocyclus tenuis TaxID=1066 RepID=UPI0019065B7D|nr:CRISPR-associated helicase Cas3' [Rhodocyclus tenuis]MBK1680702.1 CRISPR-associated helicase/endonuclease Cas3 [Rhodocyclus tenuis]